MTTFGYLDSSSGTVYTVEAVSLQAAVVQFHEAGFKDLGPLCHVRPLCALSNTAKTHFQKAAELAKQGRT